MRTFDPLAVCQERRSGREVGAEGVVLGDAMLEQDPIPWSYRVRSSSRSRVGGRFSSLLSMNQTREANVKRPLRKGVAAVFFATSSLREPSSDSVSKQASTAIQR